MRKFVWAATLVGLTGLGIVGCSEDTTTRTTTGGVMPTTGAVETNKTTVPTGPPTVSTETSRPVETQTKETSTHVKPGHETTRTTNRPPAKPE